MRNYIRKYVTAVLAFMLVTATAGVVRASDFNNAKFTPWNVENASRSTGSREKKPYTVLIFMNGSDLESEGGAATEDLIEILDSGLDSRNAHVVIFTGGARRWQNDVVPANQCMLWEVADGMLYKITGIGQANMGDAGTLSSFIDYGLQNFPADKYGLIMWDHGGGSIAGYGADEKYIDGNLTLLDMRSAFDAAGLKDKPLEFLGFDSCLMSTVEMAVVASPYARYLIASEDLEPNGGWDYSFLSVLNRQPDIGGDALGVAVVDSFIRYYGADTDEFLSLSVTDLSRAGEVMYTMGRLMASCSDQLMRDRTSSFRTLAAKRGRTKTFGEGTPRDNECDMVDIGDMAAKLSDLFPEESGAVVNALDNAVIYNRHNSDTELKGLSTYYIYGGKTVGLPALNTYASLAMDADYTQYLYHFFDALSGNAKPARSRTRSSNEGLTRSGANSEGVYSEDNASEWMEREIVWWRPSCDSSNRYRMCGIINDENGAAGENILWPHVNGQPVCLHPVNRSEQNELYAVPARLNGRDCDIMVLFNARYPQGEITGARNNEGIIIQKGYDPINPGDKVAFYYQEHDFSNGKEQWKTGRELTVKDNLRIAWENSDVDACFGLRLKDLRNDIYLTEPSQALRPSQAAESPQASQPAKPLKFQQPSEPLIKIAG